jgi:crotonobetainyl-CoA:carnitine CoA-transferase CaiB-like acyl-CoA transferase
MTENDKLKPLDGITVLDFTTLPPGAACTVLLADLGADVIRVESPAQKGKPSLVFGQVALGRGKRSITLDMRNPAATGVLARLAASADVIVENASPGMMEKRGFGYPQARATNKAIIWCAITGFGQDGPYAQYSGHDLSYLAHSGLLAALSEDLPWHPGQVLALPAAALSAAMAIQTALFHRSRSGQGSFLDISLSEAAGWFLTCGINALSNSPLVLPSSPDRRLYLCADRRFVAVACAEPRTWAALCQGLGLPDLQSELHKAETAESTTLAIADRLATRPARDWVQLLAPSGAAVTIVNRGEEVVEDEHVKARQSIVRIDGVAVPANPVRMRAADGLTTSTSDLSAPKVGDDTLDVLAGAGFSRTEVSELQSSKLI